jgi:hypothetical protein
LSLSGVSVIDPDFQVVARGLSGFDPSPYAEHIDPTYFMKEPSYNRTNYYTQNGGMIRLNLSCLHGRVKFSSTEGLNFSISSAVGDENVTSGSPLQLWWSEVIVEGRLYDINRYARVRVWDRDRVNDRDWVKDRVNDRVRMWLSI